MCTITVDGKPFGVISDDKSILDVLERNNMPVQAHCRGGYCGVCRTQKVKGEVDYHIEPLAFIDEDVEILPCSCLPVGNIEIVVLSDNSVTV